MGIALVKFQTHRSHLVNLYHVKKIIKKNSGTLIVKTHSGGSDPAMLAAKGRKEELVNRLRELPRA